MENKKEIEINRRHTDYRGQAVILKEISFALFGRRRFKRIEVTCSLNLLFSGLKICSRIHRGIAGMAMVVELEKVQYTDFEDEEDQKGTEKEHSLFRITLTKYPTENDKKSYGYHEGYKAEDIKVPFTQPERKNRFKDKGERRERRKERRDRRERRDERRGDRKDRDNKNQNRERRRDKREKDEDYDRPRRRHQDRDDRRDHQRRDNRDRDNYRNQRDNRDDYHDRRRDREDRDDRRYMNKGDERRYREKDERRNRDREEDYRYFPYNLEKRGITETRGDLRMSATTREGRTRAEGETGLLPTTTTRATSDPRGRSVLRTGRTTGRRTEGLVVLPGGTATRCRTRSGDLCKINL